MPCHDCGRDWPHGFLHDSLMDLEARVRGRCPACACLGDRQQRLTLEGA